MSRADEIAAILDGFRREQGESIEAVQRWIGVIIHGGNWSFSDPEAVSQDILLRLFQIVRSNRVQEPGGFQKLVYTVSRYTCVDIYHRERRRRAHEDPESDPVDAGGGDDPHGLLEHRERRELIGYIIQRLPPECRTLWDLVYRRRLAAGSVARQLGLTANNVRVRVHRCLEKARRIYRDYAVPPATESGAV